MKWTGYVLMIIGAVALTRGLWLLSPVAGWIGVALVAYVAGYHLSERDGGGPGTGATGEPKAHRRPPPGPRRPSVVVHARA